MIRAFVLCLGLLTACTQQQQPFLPSVSVGSGGSIWGGSATTYFADDTVVVRSWGGTPDSLKEERFVLPQGTFAALQKVALLQLDSIVVPDETQACLDYGSDFIAVSLSENEVSRVDVSCPYPPVTAGRNAIRTAASNPGFAHEL
ncbi:hypothetical protein QTO30_03560 [Yoonia sp. GPGPB17]|uniref:hypothetical protein n=1 Tax=Yoonia sp. GPGPB17 TaxID=3026147 RepID=UPI0030BEBA7C